MIGGIKAGSCGYYHTCLITGNGFDPDNQQLWLSELVSTPLSFPFVAEKGRLLTFGEADGGRLGRDSSQSHATPHEVGNIDEPVEQVSAGGAHTLLLTGESPNW